MLEGTLEEMGLGCGLEPLGLERSSFILLFCSGIRCVIERWPLHVCVCLVLSACMSVLFLCVLYLCLVDLCFLECQGAEEPWTDKD